MPRKDVRWSTVLVCLPWAGLHQWYGPEEKALAPHGSVSERDYFSQPPT